MQKHKFLTRRFLRCFQLGRQTSTERLMGNFSVCAVTMLEIFFLFLCPRNFFIFFFIFECSEYMYHRHHCRSLLISKYIHIYIFVIIQGVPRERYLYVMYSFRQESRQNTSMIYILNHIYSYLSLESNDFLFSLLS